MPCHNATNFPVAVVWRGYFLPSRKTGVLLHLRSPLVLATIETVLGRVGSWTGVIEGLVQTRLLGQSDKYFANLQHFC